MTPDDVVAQIDPQEVVDLALALGNIDSPTGSEGPAGVFVCDWLAEQRLPATHVRPDRGPLQRRRLDRRDRRRLQPHLQLPPRHDAAAGRHLVGQGPARPALPLGAGSRATRSSATAWSTTRARWRRSWSPARPSAKPGFPLKGDLIVSAVAGEISREPIEEWQGTGVPQQGPRRAVHGHPRRGRRLRARRRGDRLRDRRDRARQGPLQGHRRHRHAALLHAVPAAPDRARRRAERDRPHRRGHRGVRAVGVRLPAAATRTESPAGTIVPKAIDQRDPLRLPVQPDERAADLLVLRRHADPARGQPARPARRAPRRCCARWGRGHRRAVPVSPGFEATGRRAADRDGPRCHDQVFDTPPAIVGDPVTSMWRDTNAFNELGIPAISYAPRSASHAARKSFKVKDLTDAAVAYARIAMDLCNQDRPAGLAARRPPQPGHRRERGRAPPAPDCRS